MQRVGEGPPEPAGCTPRHDNPPAEVAPSIEAEQMNEDPPFPAGTDGRLETPASASPRAAGLTWNDQPASPGDAAVQLTACRPRYRCSLRAQSARAARLGKKRGGRRGASARYGKIYNAKATTACSKMPRLGFSGTAHRGRR